MNRKHLRRGMVLILVLVVVAMLSLGAYSFTHLMLAHHDAALQTSRQLQTRAVVDSGVEAIRLFLGQPEATRQEGGGTYDNQGRFRGVTILENADPKSRGSYSVIAPAFDADGNLSGIRYGLENESTRLNLNTLTYVDKTVPGGAHALLMALPGMTDDVADAILDWLDEDDEPREYGAELEYYSTLNPPYATKNGPIETVEELLLVKGVTPQLLFGADINRNGQLDAHEAAGASEGASTEPDAFRGWSAYLTLHSMEWNISPDRQPRIYLNSNDLNKLSEDLAAVFPEDWVTFIIAYRQCGAYTSMGTSPYTPQPNAVGQLNMDYTAQVPLAQLLDLIDAQVLYQFTGAMTPTLMVSPITSQNLASTLPQLMDYATINPAQTIPGRINVNQASATVLAGIPGMTTDISQKIISSRSVEASGENAGRKYETWLLSEGIVTLTQMRTMMPFITGGGDVYRAQVVGYYQGGQASSRAEVIFDATTPLPRIVLWRDISHLGRGYSLEMLGVDPAK
jgi:type II secretory pathway component PulK